MVNHYTKHLSEPWFSLIKCGLKTIEGRLNKGDFEKMKRNDILTFQNEDFESVGLRSFQVRITSKKIYPSFESYLIGEKLSKCLPPIETIEDGVKIYYQYYSKEDEAKYHIVAIRFKLID